MKKFVVAALAACSLAAIAAPAAAQQACTRETLQNIADKYVLAQNEGMSLYVPLGGWVNYNENFEMSSMTYGGVLAKPHKVDWHRALLDTTTCGVFMQMIVTDPADPYVIATQLSASGGAPGSGGSVSSFEVITSQPKDWLFNAEKTLYYAQREDWGVIPEAQRNTRAELRAAADAYLNLFKDKTAQVPWGTPCARLEGSAYTGKGKPDDTCNVGVPENIDMAERRYVIDETIGAVAVMLKMGPSARPDAHVFRIEGGKIRFINTVTNCGKDENCGFGSFADMVKRNPGVWPNLDHVPVVKRP
ncbi:MAG: hypothetical protein WA842_00720 [Croceibacterium sp.]